MTLTQLIDAMMASGQTQDIGSHGRFMFWRLELGHFKATEITADQVDDACLRLAHRGKLKGGRCMTTEPSGQPLAPSTITRYLTTLASVYKWAKQNRLLPRTFINPTTGLEKPTSPIDKNKYLTADQVERLISAARVADQGWGRLAALIVLGFHTGLRLGNLLSLRWCDIDVEARTATVLCTKNGDPHIAPLTGRCIEELLKLPKGYPADLIFPGRTGRPFRHTKLWQKMTKIAGMPHVTFHWLRHSCGNQMARSGTNQAMIMAVMVHKTLTASARYMHANISDKQQTVQRVFS